MKMEKPLSFELLEFPITKADPNLSPASPHQK